MINFAEYLLWNAEHDFSDEYPVTYYHGNKYCLKDYQHTVKNLIKIFDANGIKPDTSAIIMMEDSPLTISLYLSCMYYGIVPLAVNKLINDESLIHAMDTADISYVFTDGLRDVSGIMDKALIAEVQMKPEYSSEEKKVTDCFTLTVLNKDINIEHKYVDSKQIAYFLMTSGSSGMPKIVVHSHSGMIHTIKNYAQDTLGIDKNDIIYSTSKMNFGYGITNRIFFSLSTGAMAFVSESDFKPDDFFENISKLKPTILFAIPSVYQLILDSAEADPQKIELLKCFRSFVSSGEFLKTELAMRWENIVGIPVKDNVGSSEASAVLINTGKNSKRGSAGRPVQGSEIRLMENGIENPVSGTLYVKSKGNFTGYYKNDEENRNKLKDGWFKTGDVFRIDEDGDYWYIGREDNLLKYHGMWIVPEQVEQKMKEFPGVGQAVVFKINAGGKDILASALTVTEEFSDIEQLKLFLHDKMERYKCPTIYKILDIMPRNSNGKIDYAKIKNMIMAIV